MAVPVQRAGQGHEQRGQHQARQRQPAPRLPRGLARRRRGGGRGRLHEPHSAGCQGRADRQNCRASSPCGMCAEQCPGRTSNI